MTKTCSKCGVPKDESEFRKEVTGKNGLRAQCRTCEIKREQIYRSVHRKETVAKKRLWRKEHPEKVREWNKRRYENNPAISQDNNRRHKYGTDGVALLESQNGVCATCGAGLKKYGGAAHLDHCHKTKVVRGWLCQPCNMGLGCFKDDPSLLRKAAEYLERTVIFE
jgi:hypothetical protein